MNNSYKMVNGSEVIGEYYIELKNQKIIANFLRNLIPFLAAESDNISRPIDFKEYDLYDYYGKSKQTNVAGVECFFENGKPYPSQVQMIIYDFLDQRADEFPGYDLNCYTKEVKAGKFIWNGDGYIFKENR